MPPSGSRSALLLTLLFVLVNAGPPLGAQAIYELEGSPAGDYGTSIAFAGDVNADGISDFLVAAPSLTVGSMDRAGQVLVYSGADGSIIHEIYGEQTEDYLGSNVSAAGDVNQDGFDDFLVRLKRGPDFVLVFSGLDAAVLHVFASPQSWSHFGSAMDGAGDVNGDGFPDILIGAGNHTHGASGVGRIVLYSGADGSELAVRYGEGRGGFGDSVSGVGDVDADGTLDFVVGAPVDDDNGDSSGTVWVISGADGDVLHLLEGGAADNLFGCSVAVVGDVNLDGHDDFVAGEHRHDADGNFPDNTGRATLFSGADGSILFQWEGEESGDHMGYHVDRAGDIDGDGHPDILVTAAEASRSTHQIEVGTGTVYVFSGLDGSMLYALDGPEEETLFGNIRHSGGFDATGDGYPDILTGRDGAVTLYAGGPPLRFDDPVPGSAGTTNTFTIQNTTPGARIFLPLGGTPGYLPVNCPNGLSNAISLFAPFLAYSTVADGSGVVTFDRHVPARYSGVEFRFQVLEYDTCRVSPMTRFRFQ